MKSRICRHLGLFVRQLLVFWTLFVVFGLRFKSSYKCHPSLRISCEGGSDALIWRRLSQPSCSESATPSMVFFKSPYNTILQKPSALRGNVLNADGLIYLLATECQWFSTIQRQDTNNIWKGGAPLANLPRHTFLHQVSRCAHAPSLCPYKLH